MKYLVVGCSYRTAPVQWREKLALSGEALADVLAELKATPAIQESLVVSTCNRVEVYATAPQPIEAQHAIIDVLARRSEVEQEKLIPMLYRYADKEALAHIFRVTASLDAMVVGEAQVTGQVKDAFARATEHHALGGLLTRCMHRAFTVAKRVRNETDVARHPASISSVAVDLARRIFDDLADVRVLVVGAGEMASLALRHLISDGATQLRVANRSPERAEALAAEFGARSVPFDELTPQLEWADVVISSTGSPEPIVGRKLVSAVMKRRKQKPLFIVDIAVPRDVDDGVRKIANVYLFAIDDLERSVAENLKARRKAAKVGEKIVKAEVKAFCDWIKTQDAVPVIKMLREHFTTVAHTEADRTAKIMKLNGDDQRKALQHMADAIVNKLLHSPMMELKKNADSSHGEVLAGATKQLFKLAGSDTPAGKHQREGEP